MAEQQQQQKHPEGRPRLTFDLRQVEELAKIQSTHAELAAVLGCGLTIIKDRLANDEEFAAAYEKGLEAGKSSLRPLQWKAALAGNVVMQIWSGRQYLGQSDRQTSEATLSPEVRERLRRMVAAIPRERLAEITGRPLPLPAGADGVAERGAPDEGSRPSSW